MTWDETFSQLSADWKTSSPNPARMQDFLARLGHPEKELHFVHIAGTNGKGSASAMISRILTEAGYRTGLYISPHLLRINERWSIDGTEISDAELSAQLVLLRPHILTMTDKPTKFEILTALAFQYFRDQHCDIVVLEVGLGGRLDATNAIPVPDCALIMSIGLEHTEILGDTVEKIAREKGGIIKEGGSVVLYPQKPGPEAVFQLLAAEKRASLRLVNPSALTEEAPDADWDNVFGTSAANTHTPTVAATADTEYSGAEPRLLQHFSYKKRKHLSLSLLGSYQRLNACVVLEVMDVLQEKGYHISEEAIRRGLQNVSWPSRFEVVSRRPLCILDGAHNPNGVSALVDTLRDLLPGFSFTFVVGVMADKDYHRMLQMAAPLAERFIAELPNSGSDRGLQTEKLAAEIRKYFSGPVETAPTVTAGLARACELTALESDSSLQQNSADEPQQTNYRAAHQRRAIVCFGSLYQAAEVRAFFS